MHRGKVVATALVLSLSACQSATEPPALSSVRQAAVGSEVLVNDPPTGAPSLSQSTPAIAAGPDRWLVVWTDERAEAVRGRDIYGARVFFDGGVLDPTGFPISAAFGDQYWPTVEYSNGTFRVVWIDGRHVTTDRTAIWGAHVGLDGSVDVPNGADLGVAGGFQGYPFIAFGPGTEAAGASNYSNGVWASFDGRPATNLAAPTFTPSTLVFANSGIPRAFWVRDGGTAFTVPAPGLAYSGVAVASRPC